MAKRSNFFGDVFVIILDVLIIGTLVVYHIIRTVSGDLEKPDPANDITFLTKSKFASGPWMHYTAVGVKFISLLLFILITGLLIPERRKGASREYLNTQRVFFVLHVIVTIVYALFLVVLVFDSIRCLCGAVTPFCSDLDPFLWCNQFQDALILASLYIGLMIVNVLMVVLFFSRVNESRQARIDLSSNSNSILKGIEISSLPLVPESEKSSSGGSFRFLSKKSI